jgi:transposase
MLALGAATRIFLAAGATDMRKGFDGLFALVQQHLSMDPLSGHLFLFCNRPRTRLKALYWDGSGLWVCAKRLERGRFCWPQEKERGAGPGRVSLSAEELTLLLGGIDLEGTRKRRWWRREPGQTVGGELVKSAKSNEE